jgi:hypothetical protein
MGTIIPLPKRDGGNWRPPIAPGCRGSGGAPDGRGRRGAPRESECPKLSRKTEEGQKEEGGKREARRQRKTEPIDADAIPGSESRSLQ